MKVDEKEAVAIMVSIIGIVLLLGYLGTNVGSQWNTVQSAVVPFAVLIGIAIVCIAYALRR